MTVIDLGAGGYLVDLDGTLIKGNQILPDTHWLLEAIAGRYVILSNNAEHTPVQLSRLLGSMGLAVPPDRIILAGTCAIDRIADTLPGAALMVVGSRALKFYARASGLRTGVLNPDVVLIGRDRQFTYEKLAAAAAALSGGARLFVAAPDLNHPGADGKPVPETGALAAAVIACSGTTEYTVIGKPEPVLFDIACQRLGVEFADAIMIGDNPQTDGLGASRLGMRFHRVHQGLIRLPVPLAAE